MKRKSGIGIAALALVLATLSAGVAGKARADEATLAANLGGIDGLVTRCIVSSDKKFVTDMCNALFKATSDQAGVAGLAAGETAITWERAPDEAFREAVEEAGIELPLLVEFFVRGTDGNPAGASIHVLASILYEGAIEADGAGVARSGRLVIWEEAGTTSGPPGQIATALSAFVAGKMDPLFKALRARPGQ